MNNFEDEYKKLYDNMNNQKTKYKYKYLVKGNKNTKKIDILICATLEYSAALKLNLKPKPSKTLLKTIWKNYEKYIKKSYYDSGHNADIAGIQSTVKQQRDLIRYLMDKEINLSSDLKRFEEMWWEFQWKQEEDSIAELRSRSEENRHKEISSIY